MHKPEISIFADSPADLEAAKLLVGTLGLVQVEVVQSLQDVAASAHTLLRLQKTLTDPDYPGVEVLFLDGDPQSSRPAGATVVCNRKTTYVPTSLDESNDTPGARFIHAAFWMDQRLFKASRPLSSVELSLWIYICEIANAIGPGISEAWRTISSRLPRNDMRVPRSLQENQLPSPEVGLHFLNELPIINRTQIEKALSRRQMTPETFVDVCLSLSNSVSIMALSIYQWLRGEHQYVGQSLGILQKAEWAQSGTSFPRLVKNGSSLAYSPVTLLWLYLVSLENTSETMVEEDPIYRRDLTAAGYVPIEAAHSDSSIIRISESAWTLWRTLHQMPTHYGRQILLTRESYSSILHDLEAYWLSIFRSIQGRRGRVFCRILPWPGQKRAALTLRFDVDRELTETQVRSILSIQRRHFSEPAGSWYFWASDPSVAKWKVVLNDEGQEVGIHSLRIHDVKQGIGITHHSAPTSTYWQGDSTMLALDDSGALYGEFLGNLVSTPRPMLLHSNGGLRKRSKTLFTGPGFPLEGSTTDVNLDFFYRLLDRFHLQLGLGGHAVVTTHPDLNMGLLDELLDREDLKEVWISSTEQIVSRLKHLHNYEGFSSSTDSTGIKIWSSVPLNDVRINVEIDEADVASSHVVDLSPTGCYLKWSI